MNEDGEKAAPRGRLASMLLGEGRDPDPRFSLANERTFLAWIRTSLALLAGGIGVEAFAREVFPTGVRQWLAVGLILLGMLLSATASWRWLQIERAMRRTQPLPLSLPALCLAVGITLAAGIVLIFFLVRG
ncbi:MAG: YidH family protein [Cumulibacter sp.]